MPANNFLTQAAEDQNFFHNVTSRESNLNEAKPNNVLAFNDGMSFFLIYTVSWVVFFVIVLIKWKAKEKARFVTLRNKQQIYCNNCRFFSNNPYLKCALHPSIALTKKAESCSDYHLKDSNLLHNNKSPK